MIETCREYYKRLLREGWKVIEDDGEKALLQSPFNPEVYKSIILALDTATIKDSSDISILAKKTTWSAAHGATTGYSSTTYNGTRGVGSAYYYNGYYYIERCFLFFDTSSIPDSAIISAVTLSVYGKLADSGSKVCAMKGTQADPPSLDDFDSFEGSEYGHVSWSMERWNEINFNQQGIDDINKTGTTKICCREYDHDYLNVSPGTGRYRATGLLGATYASRPYLTITYSTVSLPTVTTSAVTNIGLD